MYARHLAEMLFFHAVHYDCLPFTVYMQSPFRHPSLEHRTLFTAGNLALMLYLPAWYACKVLDPHVVLPCCPCKLDGMQSLYMEACGERAKLLEFNEQIRKDDENNEAILKREVTATLLLLPTLHHSFFCHGVVDCCPEVLTADSVSVHACVMGNLSDCSCSIMLAFACAFVIAKCGAPHILLHPVCRHVWQPLHITAHDCRWQLKRAEAT